MPVDTSDPEEVRRWFNLTTTGHVIHEQILLALIPPGQRRPILESLREHWLSQLTSSKLSKDDRETLQLKVEEVQGMLDLTLPQVDRSAVSALLWPSYKSDTAD